MQVFISYRRGDSAANVRSIAEALRSHFGFDAVFVDTESVQHGSSWPSAIETALANASLMVVVMGPRWLSIHNEFHQRRLDEPGDWVRREIETGLARGMAILPVRVEGAPIFDDRALPQSIRALSTFKSLELRDEQWKEDIKALITNVAERGFHPRAREAQTQPGTDGELATEVSRGASTAKGEPTVAQVLEMISFALSEVPEMREAGRLTILAAKWPVIGKAMVRFVERKHAEGIDASFRLIERFASTPELVELLNGIVRASSDPEKRRFLELRDRKQLELLEDNLSALHERGEWPFRIDRVLGQGLYTQTYRVEDTRRDRPVTLRVLKPAWSKDDDIPGLFLKTAHLYQELAHQNLLTILEAGRHENLYYLARTYVAGNSLGQTLARQGCLDWPRTAEMLRVLSDTILPIHDAGRGHGGIKASNVFVKDDGQIVLSDPGLPMSLLMRRPMQSYNYAYAPPEMLKASSGGISQPVADYYSLGCVAYESLFGELPYSTDDVSQLIAWHAREIPLQLNRPPIANLPRAQELLARLLKLDPSERIASKDALMEMLGDAASADVKVTLSRLMLPPAPTLQALSAGAPSDLGTWGAALDHARSLQPSPPALPPEGLVGSVLNNKYLIKRRLGRGGFGAVYLAEDQGLAVPVAVKVLNESIAGSPRALDSFLQEAKLLTTLDHPNIVRWITFDHTADGLHYFVMEYVAGKELAQILTEEQRLKPKRVAHMLVQVLDALRAAHNCRGGAVLHLDLKPNNVLVLDRANNREPERVKVIDFGISQSVGAAADRGSGTEYGPPNRSDSLERTVAAVSRVDVPRRSDAKGVKRAQGGTVLYASPEQCEHLMGKEEIVELDGRSDIYSLGVMAFRMLTGRFPFDSVNTVELAMRNHLEVQPHPVGKVGVPVPRRLAAFVNRCLVKERSKRWATAEVALEALQASVARPFWRLF